MCTGILAPAETAVPAMTAVSRIYGAPWELFAESFFDNDGVRIMRAQVLEDEEALNELEPVDVWRTSDIKTVSGRVKDISMETLQKVLQRQPDQRDTGVARHTPATTMSATYYEIVPGQRH